MSEKSEKTVISFRIDMELAKQFKEIAEANNRTQSLLLRDWIIEYVKKHRQHRQTELKF